MKAGASNVGNRLEQSVDTVSYDSKISDQKSAKRKAIEEAGNKMFAAYDADGTTQITDEIKELFEKAKACDVEIAHLEKENEDNIAAKKAERKANRDAAAAADEEKKE